MLVLTCSSCASLQGTEKRLPFHPHSSRQLAGVRSERGSARPQGCAPALGGGGAPQVPEQLRQIGRNIFRNTGVLHGIPLGRAVGPWCSFGLALRLGSGMGVPAGSSSSSSRRVWGAGQQGGADGTLWGRSCSHPRVLLRAGSPVILHSLCLELYMFRVFFWGGGGMEGKPKAIVPHAVCSGGLPGYGRDIPGSLEKKEFSFLFSDC